MDFQARKGFIWILYSSFLLLIINNSRLSSRLITDYDVQKKYLSFQLPVLDTERDFSNTWSNTGCIQVAKKVPENQMGFENSYCRIFSTSPAAKSAANNAYDALIIEAAREILSQLCYGLHKNQHSVIPNC